MKTEDDKLKELFNKNLNQDAGSIPDFRPMWEDAARSYRRKQRFIWKIAATVVLISAIGVFALLSRQNDEGATSMLITAWNEPTKSLTLPQSGSEISVLANWTSPTGFLLPENNQRINN